MALKPLDPRADDAKWYNWRTLVWDVQASRLDSRGREVETVTFPRGTHVLETLRSATTDNAFFRPEEGQEAYYLTTQCDALGPLNLNIR